MQARHTMAALGIALALAVAAPVEAQLGGLGRRIGGKVAEKAAGKAVDKAADKAGLGGSEEGSASSESAAGGASYTVEKVDQFIAIVTPAVEQSQRLAAWREAKKAFEAKQKARTECMERVGATITTPATDASDEVDRINAILQPLSARMANASPAQQEVLSDSVQMLTEAITIAMYPQLKQCGPRPTAYGPEPAALDTESVGRRAKEAGFSARGFGVMRERIAAWVLTQSTEGLSPEAIAVLQQREAQLKALEPYFTTVSWQSWGDLGYW